MPTNTQTINVALIGNPNTGKSTLFNALCGVKQRTGNYPGVTIEKKIGHASCNDQAFSFIDLPGTYSLAPRSPDEMIAVDVLLGRRDDVESPDMVLCIIDASNLERNLYLVSQVLEIDRPVVIALNMVDVAMQKQLQIDVDKLRKQLKVPLVEIQANKNVGIQQLKQTLSEAVAESVTQRESPFPAEFQAEVASLEEKLGAADQNSTSAAFPRFLVERILLDVGGYIEQADLAQLSGDIKNEIAESRQRLKTAGYPVPAVEAMSRYAWVAKVLEGVIKRPSEKVVSLSDKLDAVLTNKILGTLSFIVMMVFLFSAVFMIADPASGIIEGALGKINDVVTGSMDDGPLKSLISDGLINGVGSVLVFLPQIFLMFLFIAILEDCGYMARAAYLMDKLMSRVGLSGKSFIPLLSSFACAIPGIMAARVIENRRDRLTTILVAPLMTCSARLPVYLLLTAAFIPATFYFGLLSLQVITIISMYFIGIITSVIVAFLLKKTILKGETPPFVMELPSYKAPSIKVVLRRMFDGGWEFIKGAGTIIFAVVIVIWAAAYFPRNEDKIDPAIMLQQTQLETKIAEIEKEKDAPNLSEKTEKEIDERLTATQDQLSDVENKIEGIYLEDSFLGRAGKMIEPVVKPLGWDWKIGCAAIASFPAREVIIGTLGVIYKLGEVDEESQPLKDTLKESTWAGTDEKVFNIPVALSIMVFFTLCAQCVGTLAAMKRETNSWSWPIFTFVYMTTIAYFAAMATYQVGMMFVA